MTKEETRQLGIEFERRLNDMDPNTIVDGKIDTETIYSYLNQAQDRLIKTLYLSQLQIEKGSRQQIRAEKILSQFLVSKVMRDSGGTRYPLPENFVYYVRSFSDVVDRKHNKSGIVSNLFIIQDDLNRLEDDINNYGRIIIHPLCYIKDDYLNILHDKYTELKSVEMYYYRTPKAFTPLEEDMNCELPLDCADELISEALGIYAQYAYKIPRADQKQQQRNNKQQSEEPEEQ